MQKLHPQQKEGGTGVLCPLDSRRVEDHNKILIFHIIFIFCMGRLAQWDAKVLSLNPTNRLGWAGLGWAVGPNLMRLLVTFTP